MSPFSPQVRSQVLWVLALPISTLQVEASASPGRAPCCAAHAAPGRGLDLCSDPACRWGGVTGSELTHPRPDSHATPKPGRLLTKSTALAPWRDFSKHIPMSLLHLLNLSLWREVQKQVLVLEVPDDSDMYLWFRSADRDLTVQVCRWIGTADLPGVLSLQSLSS